ncbi:MAG: SMP-30/gluconolactonase/LRE family protein [Alphaproteobacteria bacterium]
MALVGDDYVYHDKRFNDLTVPIARKELLFDQCRWSEGPVWFADGGYLVFSDIPNNRLMRYVPDAGVSVFRHDSNNANGNTRDRQGRLISCEHGGRRVTRTEADGGITVIADRYDGKRLNSPNDVVVKSDDSIWFTDPDYGIMSDYEGNRGESEQAGCFVYRVDPASGSITVVADDFVKPNGLAFSPRESTLYVADSGLSHDPDGPHHIRAFAVADDGSLSGGEVFCETDIGLPDGFRVDDGGHIWTSAGPGINCYASTGDLLGRINFPQMVSNLVFGGAKRNRLFVTCTHEIYAIFVAANGAQRP